MPDQTSVAARAARGHVHTRLAQPAVLHPRVFTHEGGLNDCKIVSGTTGLHDDFGNTFRERFSVTIGPGFDCVNVQLSGWELDFTSKDHHIDTVSVRISEVDYDPSDGDVSFVVSGSYRDKNGDDDFRWEVWYTVLGIG